MRKAWNWSLLGLCVLLGAGPLRGDFLVYKIPLDGGARQGGGAGSMPGSGSGRSMPPPGGMAPGAGPMGPMGPGGMMGQQPARPTELKIILQGRIAVNGRVVTYTHPTLKDQLYFAMEDKKNQTTAGRLDVCEIVRVPTVQQELNKRVTQAGKNADELMKAALFGLKKGLLREFYSTIDKVLEADPQHEAALRVKELKKKMDAPCADNPALEQELRSYVKLPGMKIATSDHFILLHDTPEKPPKGRKRTRAQDRLDLLEQVYESFLLLFHAQDIELDIPRDRLKVVLFNDYKDYQEFATSLSPTLSSASGFWEHERNTSVFFDHATDETYKALERMQNELNKIAEDAKKSRSNPDLVRFVRTLDLLSEVARENNDITVVSHEATHQMAGNTGLLPRHVMIPSWVHEGLATYFESPGDATWAGIGAVNEQRLEFYRALEKDREHSNIDFIVGDQIFDFALSHGAKLHGYGQAWAFTHFLLETHTKDFVAFYRMLGEMPPDVALNPALLTDLFNRVFGSNHTQLDQEWRQYMRTLKTDLERLEDASNAKSRS